MNKLPLIVFLTLAALAWTAEYELRHLLWPIVILCGLSLIVYTIVTSFA